MRHVVWALESLIVLLLTLPLAIMPRRLAVRAGALLGDLLYVVWSGRRAIAINNLSAAADRGAIKLEAPPAEVIRLNFRNLGRSFVEVIKIYYGLGGGIIRDVEIRGAENLAAALERGRGVIVITGHCGNWELSALALGAARPGVHVVARPINNPYLNRLVERTRQRYGNGIIYKKGALRRILAVLHKNEIVGILMDQSVLEPEGVAADFLGKKDYIMKTPALLAMKTGAAVVPGLIRRSGRGHILEFGREVSLDRSGDTEQEVYNNTVTFARCIEDYIRAYPSEWLWLHRRWKRFPEAGGDMSGVK